MILPTILLRQLKQDNDIAENHSNLKTENLQPGKWGQKNLLKA